MKKLLVFILFFLNVELLAQNSYQEIAQLYIPSLSNATEEEKIFRRLTEQTEAPRIKNSKNEEEPPTEKEQIELLFRVLLQNHSSKSKQNKICTINIYKNLEIFCGSDFEQAGRHLLSIIDNTKTVSGRIALAKILFLPTDDASFLQKRQLVIKELIENKELFNLIDKHLETIKTAELCLASFWKKASEEVNEYYKKSYFTNRLLTGLNKSQTALELLHLYNTFGGSFILDYIIDSIMYGGIIGIMKKDRFVLTDTFTDLAKDRFSPNDFMESIKRDYPNLKNQSFNEKRPWVKPALYAFFARGCYQFLRYEVWATISDSIEKYEATNKIHKKMNSIASYILATKSIGDLLAKNKILADCLPSIKFMQNPKQQENKHFSKEYNEILTILESKTFDEQPTFWSNKGKALAAFKMIQDSKNDFIKILKTTGKLDALMSIAKLYKKHTNGTANYCFPKYEKSDSPHVLITGFWSPFINPSYAIVNDVELGGKNERNMILTGPNAGGKSTIIRGITICLLLASTIGIVPAKEMALTPFSRISTYLNISDVAGQESCFQNEMKNALTLINSITSLKQNEFGYAVMDELFKGTNPLEGIAGSYAIAKKLSSVPNSICLFATHFKKLTELEKETKSVKNYKVSAYKNADGSFSYPFKLKPGISDQTIALDLLKFQGFDNSIVDDAQRILSELYNNNTLHQK